MSSVVQSGNVAHDTKCQQSLSMLQAAVAAATTQAAVSSAYVTHYKNCLASALANGVNTEVFRVALRQLGAGAV